jgi:hypothetical protein
MLYIIHDIKYTIYSIILNIFAFLRQKGLHERASRSRHTYTACLVFLITHLPSQTASLLLAPGCTSLHLIFPAYVRRNTIPMHLVRTAKRTVICFAVLGSFIGYGNLSGRYWLYNITQSDPVCYSAHTQGAVCLSHLPAGSRALAFLLPLYPCSSPCIRISTTPAILDLEGRNWICRI